MSAGRGHSTVSRALRSIGVLVCFATLAGCAAPPEAAKVEGCFLPASLTPGNPQDDAVQRRFGAVCKRLGREPDLDFGADTSTYSCVVSYDSGFLQNRFPPNVWKENEERRSKLAEALGRFDRTFEPRGDLIGASAGRMGWGHELLLLADKDGEVVSVLAMRSELKRRLVVKSPRAAARLVSLSKAMPYVELFWLCDNGAYRDIASWVFPSVRKNCVQIEQDVRVGFDGRIGFGPDKPTEGMRCGSVD